jgi:predicted N-acetyltransferase YhbS
MTRQWHVREYEQGDERGILDLYKLVFGTEMSTEHWSWKYERNPAGQPVIVLAQSADDEIVGHYAVLPRLVKIGDNVHVASISADLMVHPEYRGQRIPFVLIEQGNKLAAQRGIQFVLGFPNEKSHSLPLKKTGRVDLYGGIPLWTKPLNLERILKKRFGDNELLASVGSRVGNIAMRILCRSDQSTPAYSIKEIFSFDSRFDSLWNEASRDPKTRIVMVRDKAYLTWRYVEKPGRDYVIFTAEKEHDLLGYTVLRCMEDFGLQIGFIADILTAPKETGASLDLVSAAVNYFELRQMDIVGCLMLPNTRYARSLKQVGFIKTPNRLLPKRMFITVRRLSSQYSITFLADPSNWFITWSDHDVI